MKTVKRLMGRIFTIARSKRLVNLCVLVPRMFAKAKLTPLVVLCVLVPWWQKNQVHAFKINNNRRLTLDLQYKMNSLTIGFYLALVLWGIAAASGFETHEEIRHQVKLIHPGVSLSDSMERTLVQIKRDQGQADLFYMNVETVVCGDAQCRIDTVRLFWNELGLYHNLKIPEGVALEKAEGKTFTKEDYEKLDHILADKNCSLRDVYKEEIVGRESTEGVDAITGATIVLHTKDYVKGAVWTCYTLWHWVNSDVQKIIRSIHGDELSAEQFSGYLKNENIAFKIFALEQMIRRKIYSEVLNELVLEQAPFDDHQLHKLIIKFVESLPNQIYYSDLQALIKCENHKLRLLCLNTLRDSPKEIPEDFFSQLSAQVFSWNSYQEIDLILNLASGKSLSSPAFVQQVIALLDNKNFLIARRAYWYLQGEPLSKEQESKLKTFQFEHKHRL